MLPCEVVEDKGCIPDRCDLIRILDLGMCYVQLIYRRLLSFLLSDIVFIMVCVEWSDVFICHIVECAYGCVPVSTISCYLAQGHVKSRVHYLAGSVSMLAIT